MVSDHSPKFSIRAVDAASGKPIPTVKVDYRQIHWGSFTKGPLDKKFFVMGHTDSQGMISIGKLNLYSRENWLDLTKKGYWRTSLGLQRWEDGKRILVSYENSKPLDHLGTLSADKVIPLTKPEVIEIPMRRK